MKARSIRASEVAGLEMGIRIRCGACAASYGFCSSRSATRLPKRSTSEGPTSTVTRIIRITPLTTISSNRPISSPTKVTASVAAACGTDSPNISTPSSVL